MDEHSRSLADEELNAEVDLVGGIEPIAKDGGAPEEKAGVLGHEVTFFSATMLNVAQMIGAGIYAVPGVILTSVGSTGLFLIYWVLAPLFCFAGLSIYSELASMFPTRSGGEVVYLEQAYPRPRFLVSTAFAVTAVMTSLSATNAIVFAGYFLSACGIPITATSQTVTAVGTIIVTSLVVALSTKWSLRAVNVFSVFKILSLVFIVLTGAAVLSGLTPVKDPYSNFDNLFEGTSTNLNELTLGFVKVIYSFVGWHNAFNVLGEVKSRDPARTLKRAGLLSVFLIAILFFFINLAYVAAVPKEDMKNSGQLIAVVFFRNVFGTTGSKIFPLIISCSSFGNIIGVTVGQARMLREVARQGLLPYPKFFASVKPFGTPIGPVGLRGFLTSMIILALPAKDAFNFVVDLASYPNQFFQAATITGLWVLRRRRRKANIEPSPLQTSNIIVIGYLCLCLLLIILPWVPPTPGHADVSFWYATYCVAGVALLLCCGLYYWLWIIVLPKYGNYEIVEEVEESSEGAKNTKLIRRYKNMSADDETAPLLATPR
ncbi:amino acid transporter [Crepidotus variabilis]|uniref:Amino acid transporter n=1 Tax=Crepidotus variabilis TaxID=179855 RepID=A0A9P6ES14_9AGAR|nr:amino acid transporter [Crepidotus variabilis]